MFAQRIIKREDGAHYLIRYTLFKCPWFALRLHHILLSDYDCLHDHPWTFISMILWGSYKEITPISQVTPYARVYDPEKGVYSIWKTKEKQYGIGSILYRPAKWKHRLELEKPVWTLVVMFRRKRQWGFWTKKGWIPHFKYNSTQSCD